MRDFVRKVGGADFRLTGHIAFRGQGEYLYTRFVSRGQNNALIALGVVGSG